MFVTSLRRLLPVLMIFAVLYGGDSFANERFKYRVIISRPDSNITTQMRVYADNEEEARENVALNGWQILSIEKMDDLSGSRGIDLNTANAQAEAQTQIQTPAQTQAAEHDVTVSKIGEGDIQPFGQVKVKDGGNVDFKLKPAPCETLQKLVVNGSLVDVTDTYKLENVVKDTYVVAVFQKNGNECEKQKVNNDDLKEIAVIYFDLGKYKTSIPEKTRKLLSGLNKNKNYVIIGHTDDVRVIPNVEYKDNMELSVKRADFAKAKMNVKGSIKLMGMGPAYPIAPNKKEGQPLNRRAVIYERR
ncbi:MAG: OmpA family protein [Deferribacterales bacterium]